MQEGNRVLIVGGAGDGFNDWLPEMDKYIGQEATLVGFLKSSKSGKIMWVDLDIDDKEFAWSPQWLKVL